MIPEARIATPTGRPPASAEEARCVLWEKRLRLEALDRLHGYRVEPRFGLRTLIEWTLKLTGLFPRGVRNANRPVVRDLEFAFPNLPSRFDGFTLLHLSDFHFDGRPGYVEALCDLVEPVHADVCLFTGDFRYDCYEPVDLAVDSMRRLLLRLHAQHGVFASLGNHDPADLVEPYRALGIRWLINESVPLTRGDETVWLAGLDDNRFFRTQSIPLALEGVPEDAFTILLAHSPEMGPPAALAGVDLCLCGHTHGGQIRLPLIGAVVTNDRSPRSRALGPWRCGDLQGYTTAGAGSTSIPVRYNCPPEAALIRLRRETPGPGVRG